MFSSPYCSAQKYQRGPPLLVKESSDWPDYVYSRINRTDCQLYRMDRGSEQQEWLPDTYRSALLPGFAQPDEVISFSKIPQE